MGVIVQFNYQSWVQAYPEFSALPETTVTEVYWTQAQIIHRNDGGGPVSNTASQSVLLNLVVAHLAYLFGGVNGQPPPQTVGRVDAATQGSVNVSLDYGTVTNSQAWWVQSKYGAQYWLMTATYRTMRYIGGLRGCGPWPSYGGFGGFGGFTGPIN